MLKSIKSLLYNGATLNKAGKLVMKNSTHSLTDRQDYILSKLMNWTRSNVDLEDLRFNNESKRQTRQTIFILNKIIEFGGLVIIRSRKNNTTSYGIKKIQTKSKK